MIRYAVLLFAANLALSCSSYSVKLDKKLESIKPNTYNSDFATYRTYFKEYEIEIISEPPGAVIEFNNEYIGKTPLKYFLTGKFSLAGSFFVRALPGQEGQYVQYKILRYGTQRLPLPKKIYFDMNLKSPPKEYNIDIK